MNERIYEGKTTKIRMWPTDSSDKDVGIKIELDRKGWKTTCLFGDSILCSYLGLEMYRACVKKLVNNTTTVVSNRGAAHTRTSRPRSPVNVPISPQPAQGNADFGFSSYDETIVQAVERSSSQTDTGSAEVRLEQSVFQLMKTFKTDRSSTNPVVSDGLWWELKYHSALISVCLWLGLLKSDPNKIRTYGELTGDWNEQLKTVSEFLVQYDGHWTLNTFGRSVQEAISMHSFLYYLCADTVSDHWNKPNASSMITMMNASATLDAVTDESTTNRIIQIALVSLIFIIVIIGTASIVSENRRVTRLLNEIKSSVKKKKC
jgi:hypothetical protein